MKRKQAEEVPTNAKRMGWSATEKLRSVDVLWNRGSSQLAFSAPNSCVPRFSRRVLGRNGRVTGDRLDAHVWIPDVWVTIVGMQIHRAALQRYSSIHRARVVADINPLVVSTGFAELIGVQNLVAIFDPTRSLLLKAAVGMFET